MGLEIERKFLVKGDFMPFVKESVHIVQGYLNLDKNRTVRVRIRGDRGFITVKGPTDGVKRFEWEKEIPVGEASEMLELCRGVIDKTRCLVPAGGHTYEVDVFHGDNEGLVVAEIELSDPDEIFVRPEWLGEEVSRDRRYYNSQLIVNPFNRW